MLRIQTNVRLCLPFYVNPINVNTVHCIIMSLISIALVESALSIRLVSALLPDFLAVFIAESVGIIAIKLL